MRKPLAAIVLLLRFLWAVVTSGVQTARVIARGSRRPEAAFIRMPFAPMSDTGAALLGCMITLTPGTTTIDIDMGRRELLLHVLDASDVEAAVADIRRQFERYVVTLFGSEG
ncbi:MAG: Na+/H+ antiporter subunit E [Burkholderiaceae bacterium]|jgi:multisubunit Na+/H+ antiporter MnhE subunit|nr:Na+/H+ antiporter subunit E [Burkholderiaceae bacterium]